MKRLKMMLMAMIAVLAVGAMGASVASAHSANHGTITVQGPSGPVSCDFVFTKGAWGPTTPVPPATNAWSAPILTIGKDTSGVCDVVSMSGDGELYKDDNGRGELRNGSITVVTDIQILPPPFPPYRATCTYTIGEGELVGSWNMAGGPPPAEEWKEFNDMIGEVPLDTGSVGCPDPAEILDLDVHATI